MSASRTSGSRSRLPFFVLAIVVLAVAVGVAAAAYMLSGSAPAAVSLASAAPAPSPAGAGTAGSAQPPGSGGAGSASSLDGTWKVDTSIGSFSDFSDSFVGYRVNETLAQVGSTTAVGRTPKVSGTLTVAGGAVTAATVTADLTALQSDRPPRDAQLRQQALQTDQFPTATFVLTRPITLPGVPAAGQAFLVTAQGSLTLHGVTRAVSVPLQAKLTGGVVTVVGSLPISFADYGIVPPHALIVLAVDDHGTMELQLHFTRG